MNLEKNAKANERKAVVKHLQHREHVIGKKNSKVRVKGHDINQERLFRWVKENLIDLPYMMANPPSRRYLCEKYQFLTCIDGCSIAELHQHLH